MLRFLLTLVLLLLSNNVWGQSVSYTVSCCTIGTSTKLTTMPVGQVFDLVFQVQDLRPNGTWIDDNGVKLPLVRGVFAVFCDINYDKTKASILYYDDRYPQWYLPCFKFKNGYTNGAMASDGPKGMNDVGAFTGSFGQDRTPVEVWRVTMRANKAGGMCFKPDISDVPHPMCDTLVYGNIGASPPEQSYVAPADVVLIPCAVTVTN